MRRPVKIAAGYKGSPVWAASLFSLSLEGESERVLPFHLVRRVFKTGSVPVCADWSGSWADLRNEAEMVFKKERKS